MTTAAYIAGESSIKIWSVTPTERIARQLRSLGIVVLSNVEAVGQDITRILLVSSDFLFDSATFSALLDHQHAILNVTELSRYDDSLRRSTPLLLEEITAGNLRNLESLLYGNSYKGVTDLVTKWWWPRPAKWLVKQCARSGVTPNVVTLTGLALMLLSCALFSQGFFLAGLASGWLMTLLDTVDGKLARVTLKSSRLGHILDHGMDIVHPPFWYLLWGIGLNSSALAGWPMSKIYIAIVAGYVGGRLLEALFHGLGSCSMFAWRPFDAYFRLVTARRNPCLILLSIPTMFGRPDLGLLAVALWTVTSTLIMAARLIQAAFIRMQSGPLDSWLKAPDSPSRYPRAFAEFAGTRGAYE
jgi:phosphatidylglycerophosphate synthase